MSKHPKASYFSGGGTPAQPEPATPTEEDEDAPDYVPNEAMPMQPAASTRTYPTNGLLDSA